MMQAIDRTIRRSLTGIFAFFSLEYADFRCTAEELQSERHHNCLHSSLETRETHCYSKRQIFLYLAHQNVAVLKVEEALRRKASQIISVVYYSCGHVDNADFNAAKNILAAGQAVLACGAGRTQAFALKQEPACGTR